MCVCVCLGEFTDSKGSMEGGEPEPIIFSLMAPGGRRGRATTKRLQETSMVEQLLHLSAAAVWASTLWRRAHTHTHTRTRTHTHTHTRTHTHTHSLTHTHTHTHAHTHTRSKRQLEASERRRGDGGALLDGEQMERRGDGDMNIKGVKGTCYCGNKNCKNSRFIHNYSFLPQICMNILIL